MNALFKSFFYPYILFNFHVALSVVALYLIFNQSTIINYDYLGFLFFSTVFSYTVLRLLSFSGNRFFIKRYFIQHKKLLLTILTISAFLSLYFYILLPLEIQLLLVPFFIITFLYNFDYKSIPKLRDYGLLKILIVAFVWSGLIIIVPMHQHLNEDISFEALYVFLYIILLTLAFDQRDIFIDQKKLNTFPRLFKTKIYMIYLLIIIILTFINHHLFSDKTFILNEIILLLSAFLCFNSNYKRNFFYTAFWIEALPIFWLMFKIIIL